MNVPEAFKSLKNHDHSSSFNGLGTWLDQHSKGPKQMKNFYKIAASLVATAIILVACTVPVQQEEEIGYMIRGLSTESEAVGKGKIANLSGINMAEVQFIPVLHEIINKESSNSEPQVYTEVVMLMPQANLKAAQDKANALMAAVDFDQIDIMPIQETVERTFFESALQKTFNVKIDPDLSEAQISARINNFLHENSSVVETAVIEEDEKGNRHAVFVFEMGEDGKFEVKRDIEELYNDLTPGENEFLHKDVSEEDVLQLKKLKEEQKKEDQ